MPTRRCGLHVAASELQLHFFTRHVANFKYMYMYLHVHHSALRVMKSSGTLSYSQLLRVFNQFRTNAMLDPDAPEGCNCGEGSLWNLKIMTSYAVFV